MREEFNVQRAKMKELFLQKEGEKMISLACGTRGRGYFAKNLSVYGFL